MIDRRCSTCHRQRPQEDFEEAKATCSECLVKRKRRREIQRGSTPEGEDVGQGEDVGEGEGTGEIEASSAPTGEPRHCTSCTMTHPANCFSGKMKTCNTCLAKCKAKRDKSRDTEASLTTLLASLRDEQAHVETLNSALQVRNGALKAELQGTRPPATKRVKLEMKDEEVPPESAPEAGMTTQIAHETLDFPVFVATAKVEQPGLDLDGPDEHCTVKTLSVAVGSLEAAPPGESLPAGSEGAGVSSWVLCTTCHRDHPPDCFIKGKATCKACLARSKHRREEARLKASSLTEKAAALRMLVDALWAQHSALAVEQRTLLSITNGAQPLAPKRTATAADVENLVILMSSSDEEGSRSTSSGDGTSTTLPAEESEGPSEGAGSSSISAAGQGGFSACSCSSTVQNSLIRSVLNVLLVLIPVKILCMVRYAHPLISPMPLISHWQVFETISAGVNIYVTHSVQNSNLIALSQVTSPPPPRATLPLPSSPLLVGPGSGGNHWPHRPRPRTRLRQHLPPPHRRELLLRPHPTLHGVLPPPPSESAGPPALILPLFLQDAQQLHAGLGGDAPRVHGLPGAPCMHTPPLRCPLAPLYLIQPGQVHHYEERHYGSAAVSWGDRPKTLFGQSFHPNYTGLILAMFMWQMLHLFLLVNVVQYIRVMRQALEVHSPQM
jgi:hypothetical protein